MSRDPYEVADLERVSEMLDDVFGAESAGSVAVGEDREFRKLVGRGFKLLNAEVRTACLAEDGCARTVVGCHEIQERGPLRRLAEDGHVIRLRARNTFLEGAGSLEAARVGTGRATAFFGLCGEHDNSLFQLIDRDPIVDTDAGLLQVAKRALLAEHHRRVGFYESLLKTLELVESASASSAEIRVLADQLVRHALVMAHATRLTWDFWRQHEGDPNAFALWATRIRGPAFACSGYFTPVRGPSGRLLQAESPIEARPKSMAFAVLPDSAGALVVAAAIQPDFGTVRPVFEYLDERIGEGRLADAAWELGLRYCQTVVVAPAAWRRLEQEQRERVLRFHQLGATRAHPAWSGLPVPWFDGE